MKKNIFLFGIFFSALIPALFHLHIVEKDFLEMLGGSDGLYQGIGYCFLKLNQYVGLSHLTGITGRPYLIQSLLAFSFILLGHTLFAIYIVYLIPRILLFFALWGLASLFFSSLSAYLIALLPLFFLFFETYAISTLKADVFVVAFSLLSLFLYQRWRKNYSNKTLFLNSFFITLTILSKETGTAYSLILLIFTLFSIIFSTRNKLKELVYFAIPPLFLLVPFVLFSLKTTGRVLPSLFATAYDPASFFPNIKTYFFSVLYYAGINFSLSKSISLISLFILALLVIGIIRLLYKRQFALILPPLASLIGISLMNARVVQGDIVGNREILHRIAFVVPFVSLYLGFGIQTLASWKKGAAPVLLFLVSLLFIYRYFLSPFALDYTENEFYVNAQAVLTHQKEIPLTRFHKENNLCIIEYVPAGNFLVENYKKYKVSAFPAGYKELLLLSWGAPLFIGALSNIFKKK